MTASKEQIEQAAITTIVTLIVSLVAMSMFNIDDAIYSGIASGLSVTIGKEYGDSLILENAWHWKDIIPGCIGVIVGMLMCIAINEIL